MPLLTDTWVKGISTFWNMNFLRVSWLTATPVPPWPVSAGLNLSRSRCHSSVSDPGHLWTSQTRPQSEHDGRTSKFCQLFSCRPVICSSSALLPSCHNMPRMQNKPWLCTELNGVPVLLLLLYCFRTKLSFLIYKTMHFLMIHKWGFKLLFFHSVDTLAVSINIVK